MNFDEIDKLSYEEKIRKLKGLVENDVNYWKKIMLLISIGEEDTEFLDLILDNKRREIELLKEKYRIKNDIKIEEITNILKNKDFAHAMDAIINDTYDEKYTKACVEVLEILNRIPKEYYQLINKNFIIELQKRAKEITDLHINTDKDELINNLSQEGIEILALINYKFWNG